MMMVPMRPEMIRNAHLMNHSLNKPTSAVNPRYPQKTDTPNASFGCFQRLTFPARSAIFVSVLGRGADPISSRACFFDQLRTPARKGQLLLIRRSRRGS
jgi:hypothetical protein